MTASLLCVTANVYAVASRSATIARLILFYYLQKKEVLCSTRMLTFKNGDFYCFLEKYKLRSISLETKLNVTIKL